jgi:hypothetical protein
LCARIEDFIAASRPSALGETGWTPSEIAKLQDLSIQERPGAREHEPAIIAPRHF